MNPNRPVAEKILNNVDKLHTEEFVDQTYALTGDPRLISKKIFLSEKYRIAFQILLQILATSQAPTATPKGKAEEKTTALVSIPTEDIESSGKAIVPNYYKVLGVNDSASFQDIRKAYRQLAKQYHPDALVGQNLSKEEIDAAKMQMQDVNDAWFVLSRESRRNTYDDIRTNPPVAQAPSPSKLSKTPKETGVAGGLAKEAVSRGFKAGAKRIGGNIATKLGIKAAAQAIGSALPIIGNIAAFIGTEVIPRILGVVKKVLSKIGDFIFGKRDKRESVAILGGLIFTSGLFAGSLPLMIGGAIIGVGALMSLIGAVALGTGVATVFTGIALAITSSIAAVSSLLIVAIIAIPLVVAFIIFIINSGAYVVPPSPSELLQESPYVSVEKTADLSGPFENGDLPQRITYTITVKATRLTLTNIRFEWSCRVFSESGQTCPAYSSVTVNGESQPTLLPPTPPLILSPTDDPYVITYQQLYRRGQFEDSAIIDIFTVTADTEEQLGTRASGSVTIIIGRPPTECFEFAVGERDPQGRPSIDWSQDPVGQSNVLGAIAQLSLAPAYTSPLCANGTIYLYRIPINFGGGWASIRNGGTIFLYNGGTSGYGTAVYTLAHETGHIMNWRRPDFFVDFVLSGASSVEGFLHTYPNDKNIFEDFAETIGLYVGEPVYHPAKWGSFDYQTRYPRHYNFARDLFGGVEY